MQNCDGYGDRHNLRRKLRRNILVCDKMGFAQRPSWDCDGIFEICDRITNQNEQMCPWLWQAGHNHWHLFLDFNVEPRVKSVRVFAASLLHTHKPVSRNPSTGEQAQVVFFLRAISDLATFRQRGWSHPIQVVLFTATMVWVGGPVWQVSWGSTV